MQEKAEKFMGKDYCSQTSHCASELFRGLVETDC